MKSILKKGIAVLLAILCAFNLAVVSFAEETVTSGTCGENVTWSFDEASGTLKISGTGIVSDYSGWENLKDKITYIEIDDGIKVVVANAFADCSLVAGVTLPATLELVYTDAFLNCTSLKDVYYLGSIEEWCEINFAHYYGNPNVYADNFYINGELVADDFVIPEGPEYIGVYTFTGCEDITSLTIPKSVIQTESHAFYACKGLTSVTLPNTLKTLGEYTFCGCSALESIVVPESVTKIENDVFNCCTSLKSVTLPNGITEIDTQLFRECGSLEEITIPYGVTRIKGLAFHMCYSLTEVEIPPTVTTIDSSFQECSNLEKVVIPDSVTTIGDRAFTGCANLATTYYTGTEEQWNKITIAANNDVLTKNIVFNYKETITGTCGENATWAFDETSGKLTISGYGEMNDYAANNNSMPYYSPVPWADYKPYVKSIEISSGITYIGMNTFRGCTPITNLVIPEGVNRIGKNAFYDCKNLYSVSIPESVTVVDSGAFLNSQELREVYYAGDFEKWNSIDFKSAVLNYYASNAKLYFNDVLVENLIVPDGVTALNPYTFCNNDCITSVIIPESVEFIGEAAFSGNDKLETTYYTGTEEQWNEIAIASGNDALTKNVVFDYGKPSNTCGENATWAFDETSGTLTISGTGAISDYSGWKNLANKVTYVEIGNGITSVGANAFNGFTALKEVYMAESVAELGDNAFVGCSKLTIVTALADEQSFENAFSGNDSRFFFVAESGSETYNALESAGHNVKGINTDKEKDGHKVLSFEGKTTIYQNLDYNYISNLIEMNPDAYYLYFDKLTFDGIHPEQTDFSIEGDNIDSTEEYFTLNEVYISVSVNGKTVSLPELIQLLQSEDADGIISFEEKEGETFFETLSEFFEETVGELVTQAFKVIKSVLNAIRKIFK